MKILIIGSDPFEAGITTGPPVYVKNTLDGFRAYPEHEILLLCLKNRGKDDIQDVEGVRIYRVKEAPFLRTFLTPLFYTNKLKRIIKQISPDIIDLHAPSRLPFLKNLGIPIVVTLHGIVPEQLKQQGFIQKNKKILSPAYEYFWWKGVSSARHIICFSYNDVLYLKKRTNIPVSAIAVPRAKQYFTQKQEEKNKVLSVGVMTKRKNHGALLKAVNIVRKKIPGVRACVIGKANSRDDLRYQQLLEEYIKENELQENVAIISGMENEAIINEYKKAALYVQFSTQESFPGAVVEALASGTPVIASDVPGTKEAVIEGETGYLVDISDIAGLAEKISYLLEKDDLRKEMGRKAQEYARQHFASAAIVALKISLYKKILE